MIHLKIIISLPKFRSLGHCCNCVWWAKTYTDGSKTFGTCENIFTQERIRLSESYDSIENDEPTIFTDGNFGCTFHAKRILTI